MTPHRGSRQRELGGDRRGRDRPLLHEQAGDARPGAAVTARLPLMGVDRRLSPAFHNTSVAYIGDWGKGGVRRVTTLTWGRC
ncbi:hypothetical protein GCM10010464_28110 [Pseudonocardia yunnanensis]